MAMGPTGTGYFSQGENRALRYKWKVTQPEVELEELGKDELDLEATYLSLRISDGWQAPEKFNELMKKWQRLGYCLEETGKIKLTSLGFLMLDSLMDDLFRVK